MPASPVRVRSTPSARAPTDALIEIYQRLAKDVDRLSFGAPVSHVYNPLTYAWPAFEQYLLRYGEQTDRVLLVGMNPGPFGMAQTGIPFGDVAMVRDFIGIEAPIGKPAREHPKRPVLGFACPRSEVSGTRLWGFAKARFKSPERFFRQFFVLNYCPLVFMEESGRNRTPDKLAPKERASVYQVCDRALREAVAALAPRQLVGVGAFAEQRARAAAADLDVPVGCILHPSPANPRANAGWDRIVLQQLESLGIRC